MTCRILKSTIFVLKFAALINISCGKSIMGMENRIVHCPFQEILHMPSLPHGLRSTVLENLAHQCCLVEAFCRGALCKLNFQKNPEIIYMPEIVKKYNLWQYNLLHMGHIEMINGREQIHFDRVEKIVIFTTISGMCTISYTQLHLFCLLSICTAISRTN